MFGFRSTIIRFVFATLLLPVVTARGSAQTPISQVLPKPTGPILGLPPGPPVADWQPRGRAVIGGTIVVTGQNFRPADFQAAIGPAKFKLPVRLATSTASRIELEVPDEALGQQGTLAVGYAGTQGTILETSYRIDLLTPSVIDASAGGSITPFVDRNVVIRVREFSAPKANADNIAIGGTCGFRKRSGVNSGTIDRASDLSLRISIEGWFERSGPCQLQVSVPGLTASGGNAGTVQVTTPFTVAAPQQYVFDNTAQLTGKLHAVLVKFGLGNICESSTNGVTTASSDFAVTSHGGGFDVECVFRTATWVLPPGVRLSEIGWRSAKVGNRCGLDGTFSHFLPGANFSLTRGTVVVQPDANQLVSDFFVFGENTIVDPDGVTLASNLNGPRTVIRPFTIGIQCASTLTLLSTSEGTFGPTTDPQSFAFVLERLVLVGPPGLSTADLLK